MNTPAKNAPLEPKLGAINCVLAEHHVTKFDEITTKGRATAFAIAHLQRDLGQALLNLLGDEPTGTFEVQLECVRHEDEKGTAKHIWRLDIWKARQRQFLNVPVRKIKSVAGVGEAPAIMPAKLVAFRCTHCGAEHEQGGYAFHDLPKKTAVPCRRCTLPIWIQLVEDKTP